MQLPTERKLMQVCFKLYKIDYKTKKLRESIQQEDVYNCNFQ